MHYTKLLYALVLCATAQQILAVKEPMVKLDPAQEGFDKIINDSINQFMQHQIKPTAALEGFTKQKDLLALKYVKEHPSLLALPADTATQNNFQKALDWLLQQTALYILEHTPTYQGKPSDFRTAMRTGNIAIFRLLFDRLPKTNKLIVDGTSNLLDMLLSGMRDIEYTNYPFPQKELLQIRNNHLKILKMLVEAGADINAPLDHNRKPLELAAQCHNLPIIKYLISKGAKVNPPDNGPLIAAISEKDIEAIKLLLTNGADINQPVNYGDIKIYPLMVPIDDLGHRPSASTESITQVLSTLLDFNPDTTIKAPNGQTIIELAREIPLNPTIIKRMEALAKKSRKIDLGAKA